MEKRKDAQIYILCHKPVDYGIWDDFLYTPLQMGNGERFCDLRDSDEEDNISEWNGIYAECTGTYFIWKHCHPTDFKGQCQYRRRLHFPVDFDFNTVFKDFDVIVGSPLMTAGTVRGLYEGCHSKKDMELLEEVVKSLYPDYAKDFENILTRGKYMFYSNSFVMRAEHYDQYAEWLFNILGEFCRRRNWDTPEKARKDIKYDIKQGLRRNHRSIVYQQQVCGFMSERLLTLYLLHNYDWKRIMCWKWEKYEGV